MARNRIVVSDFVAQIAARLRFLRFERGLSQRELAQMAGCSAQSIVQFESGRTAMNARTMRKLALALRVEPFDILNHDTQSSDLGWLLEAMRTDANVLSFVRAKLASSCPARS